MNDDSLTRTRGSGWLVSGVGAVLLALILMLRSPLAGALVLSVGLYCLWRGWHQRQNPPDPGPLELRLSPHPGALDGDVGGWIHYERPDLAQSPLSVELRCECLYERQKSQIIEHRRETRWRELRPVHLDQETGRLGFRFEVPQGLPGTESKPEIGERDWSQQHYWVLSLHGVVDGAAFTRRFRVPVKTGEGRMSEALPDAFEQQNRSLESASESPRDRVIRQLSVVGDDQALQLICPPAPRQWLDPSLAALGLLLVLLQLPGEGSLLVMAAGLFLLVRHGFRWGRGLETRVGDGEVRVTTSWFSRPLYVRRMRPETPDQIQVRARALSLLRLMGAGEPWYDLRLLEGRRRLIAARNVEGDDEAQALKALLCEVLFNDSGDTPDGAS